MVRRDGEDESREGVETPSCASPADESSAPVIAGEPGSRSRAVTERPLTQAGRREPFVGEGEQEYGPQHEVKPAASSLSQGGSRAAHVTAKAMTADGRSGMTSVVSSGV